MIKENILKIKQRIQEVCHGINIDPRSITVVAVSKGREFQQIKEAIEAGIADIGENRIKEAVFKYNAIRTTPYAQRIKWHMVGHLQTNKVNEAVRIFDLIHSVDSLRLAEEINKQAGKIQKKQDILLEVNVSGEVSKFGMRLDDAAGILEEISAMGNINVQGLMTIAPIVADVEEARSYFRKLRELRDELNSLYAKHYTLNVLSMGMTGDFEAAIEEGANMIRLGKAVFAGEIK